MAADKEYMLRRYHARMDAAREHLGGQCSTCGTPKHLHMHHVDPSTKNGTIGQIWSWSAVRFWAEVEKCELLCVNCHQDEHRTTAPHGDPRRYWAGCRCSGCRGAATQHNAKYRALRY